MNSSATFSICTCFDGDRNGEVKKTEALGIRVDLDSDIRTIYMKAE